MLKTIIIILIIVVITVVLVLLLSLLGISSIKDDLMESNKEGENKKNEK